MSATALPSTSARSQARDRQFAEEPVGPTRPPRIPVATALSQVLAGDHTEPSRGDLQEDGHQAGQSDDPEQPVLELCSSREIGPPVARIHVADADQQGRSDESPPLRPESRLMVRDFNGSVQAFEGALAALGSSVAIRRLERVAHWCPRIT